MRQLGGGVVHRLGGKARASDLQEGGRGRVRIGAGAESILPGKSLALSPESSVFFFRWTSLAPNLSSALTSIRPKGVGLLSSLKIFLPWRRAASPEASPLLL